MISSINIFRRIFLIPAAYLTLILLSASFAVPEAHSVEVSSPIAVLPVTNLSRTKAPVYYLRQLLIDVLVRRGFDVLDKDVLEDFLAGHRIRYVAGLDRETSRALIKETGAGAVLITSLEHYDVMDPPKIAVSFRLVSTGENPEILWAYRAGLAGDDAPRLLGLGLIKDPMVLLNNAVAQCTDSLAAYMSHPEERIIVGSKERDEKRFLPMLFHRSSFVIDKNRKYTVAVLPFFNRSETKYAGEIISLQFLREMIKREYFQIIEPGVVREALLKLRVVMYDGVSLEHTAVLSSMLDADFVLTGTVIDYLDYRGPVGAPKVDFSVLLIDRKSHEAVWTSKSYNEGDEGVYFFDAGKINTASAMSSEMVKSVVEMITAE